LVGCVYDDIVCPDDGNACTVDSCDPAVGCVHNAIDCDDGDDCTADSCDPVLGCVSGGNTCASLDIQPGSCPNPVQLKKRGVVPVAIVGDVSFDVSLVDVSTVVLSRADGVGGSVPPSPTGIGIQDVATPFGGELCNCHKLTADGTLDLRMDFPALSMVNNFLLGTFANGTNVRLTLSGQLYDGTPFSASDCIRIVR